MAKEIQLVYDEQSKTWKALPDPYALIEIDTKSDYDLIIKMMNYYAERHLDFKLDFRVTFLNNDRDRTEFRHHSLP